ncbi:Sporulation and spore germination [Nocardioides exalbidus]|uniref:Sporulation and spore germination n=1 Tax=Nocardioides exalbidus TaxID=402596 RepID=A0A1H4VUL8_9ACTN|nr:GerMN domain-containing protein [Nocardioides exalbidus]SEC83974.1 Sporulation and spore germination [Nocardioides exalbidus]
MNDQLIRDLLHEAADDIEPRDRLDAIRTATAPAGRRTHRGWWAAGGAGLLAASVVTALALSTGGAPQSTGPDLAAPPTSGSTAPDGGTSSPVAVYFVGDTAAGPRLYREFRPADSDTRVATAMAAVLRGDALDPDYRSLWPTTTVFRAWSTGPDGITVTLEGAPVERPAGMSEQDAQLAMEQLVRTAQALEGQGRVPVDVQVAGEVTDTILGVPTTAPLTGAPDADVLAPVSLSDPVEEQVVADRRLTVRGRALSESGVVTTRIQRWEGNFVVAQEVDRLGAGNDGMLEFTATFDLTTVPAGQYDVIATVQNADGTVDSDTRRITIVD